MTAFRGKSFRLETGESGNLRPLFKIDPKAGDEGVSKAPEST